MHEQNIMEIETPLQFSTFKEGGGGGGGISSFITTPYKKSAYYRLGLDALLKSAMTCLYMISSWQSSEY